MSINGEPGITGEEALKILQGIMREEGINEEAINGIYFFMRNLVRRKKTSVSSDSFSKLVKPTVSWFKEKLNIGYYYEFSDEVLKLFINKKKNKAYEYLEDHYIIISTILMSLAIVVSIVMPMIWN